MNSRITVKDVVSMLLIIISFTATGIMIKMRITNMQCCH